MKRKTLTINGKRYKKTKPSDLYLVSVYDITEHRDEDGDYRDSTNITRVSKQLMSLRDVLQLISRNGCTHERDTFGTYCNFDSSSETVDYNTGDESRVTITVDTRSQTDSDRLERAFCADHGQRLSYRLQRDDTRKREAQARARRELFTVHTGSAWLSKRSSAKLTRVI